MRMPSFVNGMCAKGRKNPDKTLKRKAHEPLRRRCRNGFCLFSAAPCMVYIVMRPHDWSIGCTRTTGTYDAPARLGYIRMTLSLARRRFFSLAVNAAIGYSCPCLFFRVLYLVDKKLLLFPGTASKKRTCFTRRPLCF